MDVQIRFRFNKATGEVEVFEVDQEIVQDDDEHHREHDRLAAAIGGLLEKSPRIVELPPDPIPADEEVRRSETDDEDDERETFDVKS